MIKLVLVSIFCLQLATGYSFMEQRRRDETIDDLPKPMTDYNKFPSLVKDFSSENPSQVKDSLFSYQMPSYVGDFSVDKRFPSSDGDFPYNIIEEETAPQEDEDFEDEGEKTVEKAKENECASDRKYDDCSKYIKKKCLDGQCIKFKVCRKALRINSSQRLFNGDRVKVCKVFNYRYNIKLIGIYPLKTRITTKTE